MYAEEYDNKPYKTRKATVRELMARAAHEEAGQLELLAMSGDADGPGAITAFECIEEDDL